MAILECVGGEDGRGEMKGKGHPWSSKYRDLLRSVEEAVKICGEVWQFWVADEDRGLITVLLQNARAPAGGAGLYIKH